MIKRLKELYIRFRNSFHPGYGACLKCGANWGWKKHADHMVSESEGLFLFCVDCDKVVTEEERWKALDEWKAHCIGQTRICASQSEEERIREIEKIKATEFMEFPRMKGT